jgi:hypothetical protein
VSLEGASPVSEGSKSSDGKEQPARKTVIRTVELTTITLLFLKVIELFFPFFYLAPQFLGHSVLITLLESKIKSIVLIITK